MTFIDSLSRFTWTYLIKYKSDAFKTYVNWEALYPANHNAVGALRSDNGGEYTSNEFKQHLNSNGTFAQRTTPYTPQQNGTAERMNRTLFESANALLIRYGLPPASGERQSALLAT